MLRPNATRRALRFSTYVKMCCALVWVVIGCRSSESLPAQPSNTLASPSPPSDATTNVTLVCPDMPPCDEPEPIEATTTTGKDKLTLVREDFSKLTGWNSDALSKSMPAFRASCVELDRLPPRARVGSGPYGGRARDWRKACRAAKLVPNDDNDAARSFYEAHFAVYAAMGKAGRTGKITGYYVQPLRASATRAGKYQFPILARPVDLVSTQLSEFIRDGRSRRIWGRVDTGTKRLIPYHTRREIRGRGYRDEQVLLWSDDPIDVLSLEIEGSGKATLPDGSIRWVAFAGKNGRSSRMLSRTMRSLRELKKQSGPLPKAGAKRQEYLRKYHQIVDKKSSVVFFEIEQRAGAIGTQNVVLTPRRSLAVDRAVIPLSTPVWVDTRARKSSRSRVGPWRQLLIAQDTGGHILGTIRGDIYWGDDREAHAIGSRTNGPGKMWLLLPKSIRFKSARP